MRLAFFQRLCDQIQGGCDDIGVLAVAWAISEDLGKRCSKDPLDSEFERRLWEFWLRWEPQWYQYSEDFIFRCVHCGWWCEVCEMCEVCEVEYGTCTDCCPEEDEEW